MRHSGQEIERGVSIFGHELIERNLVELAELGRDVGEPLVASQIAAADGPSPLIFERLLSILAGQDFVVVLGATSYRWLPAFPGSASPPVGSADASSGGVMISAHNASMICSGETTAES